MVDANDEAALETYKVAVNAFKLFCAASDKPETWEDTVIDYIGDDPFEEINFYDVSLGFFIALGVPWDDAFRLARIVRYDFQYWS
jgi:hypothetical protein